MSFNVSNEAFLEAFGQPDKKGKVTEKFLEMLKKYLRTQKGTSAGKMRAWIGKGGGLCAFTCRADAVRPLSDDLTAHRIPYILVEEAMGDIGFLIRDTDIKKVKEAITRTLRMLSHYCRVTSCEKAGMAYLKQKVSDKEMLYVSGLSREEAVFIGEESGRALPDETIGIDRMADGTWMVACHGKTAVNGKPGKENFGSTVAMAMVAMNSETKAGMRKKAAQKADYNEKRAAGFPDRNGKLDGQPVWVVGASNRFVKRTASGFELGHAVEIDESIVLENDLRVNNDDPRYYTRLNSALAKVCGNMCLYSLQEVIRYFKSGRKFDRGSKTTGQKDLILRADAMITKKVMGDSITHMDGRWNHKFRHYQHEMGRLLIGVRDGKIPKGYTRQDILELREIAAAFSLDVKSMTPAISKIMNLEIMSREAGPQRINNVEKEISRYTGERQGQEESRDRSKTEIDR